MAVIQRWRIATAFSSTRLVASRSITGVNEHGMVGEFLERLSRNVDHVCFGQWGVVAKVELHDRVSAWLMAHRTVGIEISAGQIRSGTLGGDPSRAAFRTCWRDRWMDYGTGRADGGDRTGLLCHRHDVCN